jgi:hypothetical protein
LLIALLIAVANLPSWIPAELKDPAKFVVVREWTDRGDFIKFRRVSDDSELTIDRLMRRSDYRPSPIDQPAAGHFVQQSLDGLPLGSFSGRNLGDTTAWSHVQAPYEQVRVIIQGPLHTDERGRWIEKRDYESEAEWVENIARKALAGYASERLKAEAKTVRFDGKSVKAFTSNEGLTFVDLSDLSDKMHFEVQVNSATTRASFTFKKKAMMAVLGACSVKIGSDWHELPDTIMLKSGHFLLPINAFQQ